MKISFSVLLLLCCGVLEGQMLTRSQQEYSESKENDIQIEDPRPENRTALSEKRDLQTVLREMSAMLAELKVEQRRTTTAINKIEIRLKASESQVQELRRTDEAQSKVNEALTANQGAVEERLKNKVEELKTSLTNTANQVENLKQESQVSKIAFSAGLWTAGPQGHTGPFNTDIVLVFRFVYTNFGQAYNPNTGTFTAPVRGVYHFRFSIHGHGSNHITVNLYKNSNHVVATGAFQPQGSVSTTNGIAIFLEVGDVVYLKLPANNWIYDDRNHHSTFNGHLLFTL